ncbi:hypothetical protein [Clostridium gasigenes]|uniref:hypothetical protein n=1 Tax=Clostridium gasigenes TaxID=94869 RepID=UPI001C0C769D|nr:hypothetical protein [Clostridium gasigenes]MBU3107144.1 hypothetical protein [Clostridium gasigenes]
MAYSEEDKAIAKIKGYLNVADNPKWTKEYMLKKYGVAIEILVEQANKISAIKAPGVKSFSEGGQSMTFSDNVEAWTITEDIKEFLPTPFVKLMG